MLTAVYGTQLCKSPQLSGRGWQLDPPVPARGSASERHSGWELREGKALGGW